MQFTSIHHIKLLNRSVYVVCRKGVSVYGILMQDVTE